MRHPPSRPSRTATRSGGGSIRIIGGQWRSRSIPIAVLPGLRPTPDRVRETLFNWITHALGGLDGRSVLDLYAGSGALGFEAASRGADPAVLVELQPLALDHLYAARERLEARQVEICAGDALQQAERLLAARRTFDLVFLDPPFGQDLLPRILPVAVELCSFEGLIYVEAAAALVPSQLEALSLEVFRADKAGEVFYHLLQRKKLYRRGDTPCW